MIGASWEMSLFAAGLSWTALYLISRDVRDKPMFLRRCFMAAVVSAVIAFPVIAISFIAIFRTVPDFPEWIAIGFQALGLGGVGGIFYLGWRIEKETE